MANGPLGLHHPVVMADDLDALAGRFRALGFAPAPKFYHPWGTAVQHVRFPDGGIALAGIDDVSLIDEAGGSGLRLGRLVAEQLGRREGIALVALHSDDARADADVVAGRGVEPDGMVDFDAEVTLADGATVAAAVSLAMLIDWDHTPLSFAIRQQHRPAAVPTPAWMEHPNGAHACAEVVYAVPEPYALWQRFAGIWGEAALADLGNGFTVATAGGDLLVLDRSSAQARFAPVEMPYGWRDVPCAVAMTVRVADLNRVHMLMMQNGVPHLRMAEVVRIPPSHAGNVILDFAS
ncbi:MAG: VOC family protein [Acetobacteraceae bacterium]